MWDAMCLRTVLALVTAASGVVGGNALAQINEEVNARPDPYAMDPNFFKLPEGRTIGGTVALALDPDGTSIWLFERCGGNNCVGSELAPILKFDSGGNLVRQFGAGMFVRPHGLHVDADGNVWVTDDQGPDGEDPRREGKGHQVFKFNSEGELLMTLGKAGVAGDGPDEFNAPSAVFVAPNGDIFVGDGHGGDTNARMLKFSADGALIKIWGRRGTGPGEFETPHAIAMDSRGRLFVGDRGNNRIQIFDQDGNFLEEWTQFSRPSGIHIDRRDVLYVADSSSDDATNPGWKEGIRIGSAADGRVTAFIDDPDPDGSMEGVVADVNGVIYGSLTNGMALRRYVKR